MGVVDVEISGFDVFVVFDVGDEIVFVVGIFVVLVGELDIGEGVGFDGFDVGGDGGIIGGEIVEDFFVDFSIVVRDLLGGFYLVMGVRNLLVFIVEYFGGSVESSVGVVGNEEDGGGGMYFGWLIRRVGKSGLLMCCEFVVLCCDCVVVVVVLIF